MTTPTEPAEPAASGPSVPAGAAPKRSKKQKTKPAALTVEHSAHGRTRARLSKEQRTPEMMAAIEAELQDHPDVTGVKVDHRTGSVVIEHGKEREGRAVMREALQDVELLAGLLLDVPVGEEEEQGEGEGEDGGGEYGRLDRKLAQLASAVDEWQAQKTGIRGRGSVLAGAIAGLGVAQIALYGISLEMLPGPILLYIAYDVRRKILDDERAIEARRAKAKGAADNSPAVSAPASHHAAA